MGVGFVQATQGPSICTLARGTALVCVASQEARNARPPLRPLKNRLREAVV